MNRTKNAVRNIWWGIIQKFIMLLFPFITRTFLIRFLGAEYLGLSGLFTSILSLLSLTELGISSAIISTMYKPIADNDTDTVCALMAFYRKVYYIIGCVIIALGILIIPFLHKFIKGDLPVGINLYILYLIYLLILLLIWDQRVQRREKGRDHKAFDDLLEEQSKEITVPCKCM